MKTYVAIPSCRDWKPHFGASMCGLVHKMTLDGDDFTVAAMMGTSVLPKARQLAMEHAIQEGFTHILFLDDDMSFPSDLHAKLATAEKDVVGVNYSNKSPNPSSQAHDLSGEPIISGDLTCLSEVGWIGFGAVLINLNAIKAIPKPWFEMRWLEDRGSFIGEDYYFCGKVRAHGVKIFLDHSVKMGHVGDHVYREVV